MERLNGWKFVAALSALWIGSSLVIAHADTITTLFDTGVDSSGIPLSTAGLIDPHYTNGASGPVYTDSYPYPAVYPNSNYVTVDQVNGTSDGGYYTTTFSTSFMLPTDTILSTVDIAGNWSVDDAGLNILINGNATGLTQNGWWMVTPFVLPTEYYQTGDNTLSFEWGNNAGPGGINVAFTTQTFTTYTPEPSVLVALGALALSGSTLACRRHKRIYVEN